MMVSIRYDCNGNGDSSTHCCDGAILNDKYILTTARCFDLADNSSLLSSNITIAHSIHSLSQDCQTIRAVKDIFIHPNWTLSDDTMHNIAVLRLTEPLNFKTDFILSSACLPSQMDTSIKITHDNISLVVVGWNAFSNSGNKTHQVLRQLIVYPVDDNDSLCSSSIDDNQSLFCVERNEAGCYPEGGGLAFQWIGNRWELVGIRSDVMDNCSQIGYEGVFVRVAAYYTWIESILNSENTLTSSTETVTSDPSITTSVKPSLIYECNRRTSCGCSYSDVAFRPTRIVGGEDAEESSWSMIVSLQFHGSKEHFCAGTLLSSSYVLTAAHCVNRFSSTSLGNITIVAGITNRSDSAGYRRNIDQVYIHQNYSDWPHFLNDIALLHMDGPVYFQNNPIVAKTCVPHINTSASTSEQYPENGTPLVVIGWGAMKSGSVIFSEYLKQLQISAIDNQDEICEKTINNSELQFCAGLRTSEKDACLGDSGGPILYWTGHYWEQVGIIGYNFNCGRPGYPGIHTRLSYYWQWMKDILNRTNEHLEPQSFLPLPTTISSTRRPTMTTTRRISQTTTSSDALPSSTITISDISSTNTDSNSPHTMTFSSTIPSSTFSIPIIPETTTSPGIPATLTTTSLATAHTMTTTLDTFSSLSTVTLSDTPQTMTPSSILASSTVMSSVMPPTTTSSDTLLRSTTTVNNISQTMTSSGISATLMTTSSDILHTINSSSTLLLSTVTTSDISQTMTASSTVPSISTNTTSNRTQTTTSYRTLSTRPASPVVPHITTTTVSSIKKITYECKRIPDECGCSLSNVVLSYNNQSLPSMNGISENAHPYSWSMVVSIRINGTQHTCTGTILGDSFILTTAECVANHIHNHNITIAAGIHNLSQHITLTRTVANVYVHENYTNTTAHLHDIAVLRLQQPLELKAQPVLSKTCLFNAKSLSPIDDSNIVTIGWRHAAVDETADGTLQQVSIKSITTLHSTCFNSIYNGSYQFCAGLMINATGACTKNFGEPVFIFRNEYWEQIGMLSKTRGCSSVGHSGVYTRLSAYTDWIQRIMADTPIPMRQPVHKSSASTLKQNIFTLNILLVVMKIFH